MAKNENNMYKKFVEMSGEERAKYVNEKLETGMTIVEIAVEMDTKKPNISKKMGMELKNKGEKWYKYNGETNRYEPGNGEETKKEMKEETKKIVSEDEEKNKKIDKGDTIMEKIESNEYIASRMGLLEELLREHEARKGEFRLEHEVATAEKSSRGLPIGNRVYAAFQKLVDGELRGYKKQDLLTQAVLEFIQKYGNGHEFDGLDADGNEIEPEAASEDEK